MQEAVLPRVDSFIHAHPYSFRISRLLSGIDSMIKHRLGCCKDIGRLFLGEFQSFPFDRYIRAITLYYHREKFRGPESQWLTLEEAISSTQARKATDPRDHFFGILGLLPQEWQDIWIRDYDYSYTAAEIFGQCTKLLYANSYSLEKLSSAIGVKGSELPSWSIDLSNQLRNGDNDHHRWVLYDASGQPRYEGVRLVHELAGLSLAVKATPIGTVGVCARRVSHDRLNSNMVLSHISEWQRLYEDYTDPLNTDRFWRAAFMDRDIQRDWLHNRKQLPRRRLDDINRWWRSCNETGDSRDIDLDKQAGDGSRGNYHYRALKLNAEKHRFFCTAKGEPAFGPHDVRRSDEVYVLAGCKAPCYSTTCYERWKGCFLVRGSLLR